MKWDVVVVGGGPAGLFAAVFAAEAGARAIVLERMPIPGRKLLVSGSGQCNLTHAGEIADFLDHYGGGDRPGDAGRFLRTSLYAFSNKALGAYCAKRGVPLEEAPDGRVFPSSRRAQDLLDLLLAEARRLHVEVRTGVRIGSARAEGGLFTLFPVGSPGPVACGRSLVLATGGRSYPALGSSGDGYRLAASFGHGIAECAPALAPIIVELSSFAPFVTCAGLSLSGASVAVFRKGRRVSALTGDALFTHRGLSGPAVLDLSRCVRPGDDLRISLAPDTGDARAVERLLVADLEAHGRRTVVRVLQGFGLAERLSRSLLASHGLDRSAKAATLTQAARRSLATSLAAAGYAGHPFPVAALGGWDEAMVTRGGIVLAELDPKTLESRLVRGLFCAGELLDVDGDTGGYNLQAALSTGRLAGLNAARAARHGQEIP